MRPTRIGCTRGLNGQGCACLCSEDAVSQSEAALSHAIGAWSGVDVDLLQQSASCYALRPLLDKLLH